MVVSEIAGPSALAFVSFVGRLCQNQGIVGIVRHAEAMK